MRERGRGREGGWRRERGSEGDEGKGKREVGWGRERVGGRRKRKIREIEEEQKRDKER